MRHSTSGKFDRLKVGKNYDGTDRAFAKAGEPAGLQVHHDANDARTGDRGVAGNLARDGASKRLTPVSVHNGMHTRSRDGGLVQSGTAASFDSNPANPLNAGPPRGKRLTPVMATPGMRSQSSFKGASLADLSRRIFDTAHGDSGDRAALGIGALPGSTTEASGPGPVHGDCPMDKL